jgi:anti-anti-sigma regulatory factor/anti-sigma regulatory factor (Ser/Thr protein kinase)
MSGQVSFEVEHTRPVAIVRPHGVLDIYTANDLRGVLMDTLVDQPTGVIVDTTQLSIADDLGLTVLAGVARDSLHWPGTRFVLTGLPAVHSAAIRLGVDQFVTLCKDDDAAQNVLEALPVPPVRRDRMRPDRNAPGLARLAVQEFCEDHEVGGDGDAAQLVASELVTNAVVHAGTEIDLTVRLISPLLHIAVRDTGPGQARIADIVDESAPTGRGLLLVDALSTGWGNLLPTTGKVVWATVRVRHVR